MYEEADEEFCLHPEEVEEILEELVGDEDDFGRMTKAFIKEGKSPRGFKDRLLRWMVLIMLIEQTEKRQAKSVLDALSDFGPGGWDDGGGGGVAN